MQDFGFCFVSRDALLLSSWRRGSAAPSNVCAWPAAGRWWRVPGWNGRGAQICCRVSVHLFATDAPSRTFAQAMQQRGRGQLDAAACMRGCARGSVLRAVGGTKKQKS
jgi:hypothetical protein